MTAVTIRVDASEALQSLDDLARQQVPFALSRAMGEALKGGQAAERQHLPQVFTLRRAPWVERSIKISKFPTKRDLVGIIETEPPLLAKFELGGRKVSASGRALTVPIAVRRNKSGIVTAALRVRSLQLRAHRTKAGKVQLKGLLRSFTVKGNSGGAILQRVGRKAKGSSLSAEIAGGSVRLLYAFRRSVPIPANLAFTATITASITREWPRHWEAAWNYALATARR